MLTYYMLVIMMFNGGISQIPMGSLEECQRAAKVVEYSLMSGIDRKGTTACVEVKQL